MNNSETGHRFEREVCGAFGQGTKERNQIQARNWLHYDDKGQVSSWIVFLHPSQLRPSELLRHNNYLFCRFDVVFVPILHFPGAHFTMDAVTRYTITLSGNLVLVLGHTTNLSVPGFPK